MTSVNIQPNFPGEACDTLFYQGMGCSQTHVTNYVGTQKVVATTGEYMWCKGRNGLMPIEVIYGPHIGAEIEDVNLNPFPSYFSYLNPIKVVGAAATWAIHKYYCRYEFAPGENKTQHTVAYHAPVFSAFSIGQETDIRSHRKKYDTWLQKPERSNGLILWGVSRGTAATFCAYTKFKYPEVKLVVLEGAIDSIPEVIYQRALHDLKFQFLAKGATSVINTAFSLFNKLKMTSYSTQGPSPLQCVADFPEGTPVIFITSKADTLVPPSNTERLAQALADRGKNDVYLVKLERASHVGYMYDCPNDRAVYQGCVQALYKKLNLQHDPKLAEQYEGLLEKSLLPNKSQDQTCHRKNVL